MKRLYLLILAVMLISLSFAQQLIVISGSCTRIDTGEVMMDGWFPDGLPLGVYSWDPDTGVYFAFVPLGWSGVVTPAGSIPGSFSPATRTYTNAHHHMYDESYAFTPLTYDISGRIVNSFTGLGIGNIYLPGLYGGFHTDADGYYLGHVLSNWSGTVTPNINTEGSLNPEFRVYTNVTTDQRGQDYIWTPVIYTVSGTITSALTGEGIAGVCLNGLPGIPQTDAAGHYSTQIQSGFSGTVMPSYQIAGTFSPGQRIYTTVSNDMVLQDYTWTVGTYTISGFVTRADTGGGMSGVTFVGFPNSPVTDSYGHYSATVPYLFSGSISPVGEESGVFNPEERVYYNVSSHYLNQNFVCTVTANEDEVSTISNLQVFPNPVRTDATIKLNNENNVITSICIFNAKGQQVKSFTTRGQEVKWVVNGQANGVYLIRIISEKTKSYQRILVIK